MVSLIHARCGGLLVPIADPPWFDRLDAQSEAWHLALVSFARCDRCGLEGEVTR